MKNMSQKKNKEGQTLLEIIAVLVIIGAILAAVIPAVTTSTDNGRIRSAVSAIRAIQSAAVGYYNDNGGSYASVSIANLAAKYLPAGFTGTGANPWSGNITVAVNGATTNQYVLTMTNVPSHKGVSILEAMAVVAIVFNCPAPRPKDLGIISLIVFTTPWSIKLKSGRHLKPE